MFYFLTVQIDGNKGGFTIEINLPKKGILVLISNSWQV